MPKKEYVQAKKDIEALLQENGDSEICAGISEYSSAKVKKMDTLEKAQEYLAKL